MSTRAFWENRLFPMRVLTASLLAISTVATSHATAASLSCTNREFQISCDRTKCENADGFTPMQLTLDLSKKRIEICAYSDCWTGALTAMGSNSQYTVARGDKLRPNATHSERQTVAVILDNARSSAAFAGFGFVTPMSCQSN